MRLTLPRNCSVSSASVGDLCECLLKLLAICLWRHLVHDDRGNSQTDPNRNRHRLHTVKAVAVATFKQNRRGNMKKNTHHKRSHLPGICREIGVTGDQEPDWRHGTEDAETNQGAGFLHSRLQEHA